MNGQEDFRQSLHKFRLKFRSEHQVAIAFFLGRKCGKDPSADTKIGRTHVRAFLCTFEAQGDPTKIRWFHRATPLFIVRCAMIF